jgi:geranylgeranyl diphosphate synthase, type III
LDGDETRKGKPATHMTFGIPKTIASSIFNYFRIHNKIMKLTGNDIEISNLYNNFLINVYRAEGYDQIWIEKFYCPTESELAENNLRKSRDYFQMSIKLMQFFSENKKDFSYLSRLFSIFFQYRDDYDGLFMPDDYYEGRETFAKDLEGVRFTLPFVHAIKIKRNQEFAGKT